MTPRQDAHAHFRSLPIFAGCTEDELEEIDRLADEVHVEQGRTIIRQGDLGQEFAVIVDGEADVVKDGDVVASIGPGAYFGEVALLDAVPRTASIGASTPSSMTCPAWPGPCCGARPSGWPSSRTNASICARS